MKNLENWIEENNPEKMTTPSSPHLEVQGAKSEQKQSAQRIDQEIHQTQREKK